MAFALGQLWWFTVWTIVIFSKMDGCSSCLENERKALLDLKAFVIENSPPDSPGADVFPDWTNGTKNDCCRWEGIQCSLANGHVIGINMYWLNSKSPLNLSLLHPFEELQSLNISGGFGGWFDPVEGYKSLRRLRKLHTVDLSYSDVNNSIFPFFSAATSLKTLILHYCNLEGRFPMQELKDMRNLEILDLSENILNGSLPGKELASLYNLKALDLGENEFSGSVETRGICRLKNLQELDLSYNNLGGYIPSCFGGLSKLKVLDMSENHLIGSIPTSISNLVSLEYLSLNGNNFESSSSLSPLTNLSKLKVLKLSSVPELLVNESEQGLWQPKFQLNVIELTYCNLGEIPNFLKYQRELRKIDLSNNKLFGVFPAWLLENNVKLEILRLESNALTMFQLPRLVHSLKFLDVSANHFVERLPENIGEILPNIRMLDLSHNGFQGYLPSSVGEMKSMELLDLSYNNLSGILSRSLTMDCHSLLFLVLSHNGFSGHIFQISTNLTLEVLKLDNNQFTGEIGDGLLNSSYLSILDLSNNYLRGAIPTCPITHSLSTISLANNNLEGEIPVSLFNHSERGVDVFDLSGNMLSGSIPPRFISGRDDVHLYLHDNDLTGPIPDTLLENLQLLDLRYNKLSGSIPQFLHTQSISILLLGGNRLTGHIPMKLCSLTKVILLNLAYNSLNGSIPSCLRNLSFGLGEGAETRGLGKTGLGVDFDKYYKYNSMLRLELWSDDPPEVGSGDIEVDFTAKHRSDSYSGYMYGLDLAGNDLSGEIPKELGDLQRMRALNLSHNSLSGHIPKSFSNMTDLESLDLSFNKLSGSIPREFIALHSLAVFNVSYNNLSGIIPQGAQMTTFDNSSYTGNPLLCGQPTNRSCSPVDDSETEEGSSDEDSVIDMVVFYWSLTGTYVTVFGGFLLLLCFDTRPRQAWLNFIDALIRLATRA